MKNYLDTAAKYQPDIGYVPTTPTVVEAMLNLARVSENDIIYDLGSGDGRILITAAQKFGAKGVGVDIDPKQVQQANENARRAGLGDRIRFRHQNLYECDFSKATVVMLYLLPHLNLKLRPSLFQQLNPGTRIVSHDFDMGNWQPEQTVYVDAEEPATLYYWVIPADVPPHL